MKKTILQIIAAVISVTLIFSTSVMAEEVNPTENNEATVTESTEPVTYTLTLSDAINLALTENPQLISNEYSQTANEINIKSASLTKSQAKNASKAATRYGIFTTTTIEEILNKKGYYVNAARVQHELSVLEKQRIEANISYQVTNAYYNVLLMDMLVNAAKNSYDLALNNKKIVDAQYEQGYVARIAYDNAGIAVDGAKCELEAYELNRDIAMRNLKNQLNVKPDSTLILTGKIETQEFTSDVEADIKNAFETRYDIIGAKKAMDLSYEYFDASDAFTSSSAVYNTAYADYISKKYQYDNALKLIDLAIRSEYNTIVTNHASMKIAERTYNMHLAEYEAAKLQYDLGLITNLELTDKINNLYKSEISYSQEKVNYRMAVEKYKYDISIGLPQ